MIKDKSEKTILEFSKKILELIKEKNKRYINIMSLETVNIMKKISKDYTLINDKVYLKTFYDGKKIVGGIYGIIYKDKIFDIHSIIFSKDSFIAKRDLLKSYKEIMNNFKTVEFNVVSGSDNEKFHDSLFMKYAKICSYQYKTDGGTYVNIFGKRNKLTKYKAKFL